MMTDFTSSVKREAGISRARRDFSSYTLMICGQTNSVTRFSRVYIGWLSGFVPAGVTRDWEGRRRKEFAFIFGSGVGGGVGFVVPVALVPVAVVGVVLVTRGVDDDPPPPPHPRLPVVPVVPEFAVNVRLLTGDVFPALSLRVMLRVFDPLGSAGDIVTENVPVGHTTVVPMMVPEVFLMITVDPTSPVPVMVGVRVVTVDPLVGAVMVGVVGAVVSMVPVNGGVELLVQLVVTIGSHALTVIGSGVDGIAVVGIE
jgi:hypothetical protein